MIKGDRQAGKVKFFNEEKMYGFISPNDGGDDLFFHITDCPKGTRAIERDASCTFVRGQGKKGPKADSVELVD